MRFSRRNAMTAGGALALGALAGFGNAEEISNSATDDPLSDEEIVAVLDEEGEPGFVPRATIQNFWFQEPSGTRPSPNWPSDDVSYDYRHLGSLAASGTTFDLSQDILRTLVERNAFDLGDSPKVLFGLRGCTVVSGEDYSAAAAAYPVVTTRPDHLNMKCLIGIWNRQTGDISLARGSTVPNVDLMQAYVQGALGCNMLPTGLHQYRVGPHRGSKQPGAFRQQQSLWVLRSPRNLEYAANDRTEIWDDLNGDLPFDNIHAAILNYRSEPPFFSSAGCQVVAGRYRNGVPVGAWANFRQDAGLAHPPVVQGRRGETNDDGVPFSYVLLTGDEASLVAQPATQLRTLRYGSTGSTVAAMQEKLGLSKDHIDGAFLRRTLGAVLTWQKVNREAATGIVSEAQAERIGVSLR